MRSWQWRRNGHGRSSKIIMQSTLSSYHITSGLWGTMERVRNIADGKSCLMSKGSILPSAAIIIFMCAPTRYTLTKRRTAQKEPCTYKHLPRITIEGDLWVSYFTTMISLKLVGLKGAILAEP